MCLGTVYVMPTPANCPYTRTRGLNLRVREGDEGEAIRGGGLKISTWIIASRGERERERERERREKQREI